MPAPIDDLEIEWFRDDLLAWYQKNGRTFPWRSVTTSLYQHAIAEILLQRTRAERLVPFFVQFVNKYENWESLAQASLDELTQEFESIGLATQRAPRVQALAQIMDKKQGKFPTRLDELQALPAIGQYVAYAIQAYQGQRRRPLLDAGMARVVERCFGSRQLADIRYDDGLQEICHRIVDIDETLVVSWAILDLAALVCRVKNPNCDLCPFQSQCEFASRRN